MNYTSTYKLAATALSLAFGTAAFAAPVSPDVALTRLKGDSHRIKATQISTSAPKYLKSIKSRNGDNALHLFDLSSGGFLVLPADDCITPLLGYSDNGNLSATNLPEGLTWWLNMMADEVENATIEDTENTSPISQQSLGPAISPIVAARWGQSEPFNAYTPIIDDAQTPTGCVATALTQIMHHYRWPAAPIGEVTYTDTSKEKREYSMSYEGISFDWNLMPDVYAEDASPESINAVATLMKAVGYGVHMTYAKGGSGATDANALAAMTTYFGYSKDARMLRRESFNRSEWDNLLYSMLSAGLPIYYTGRDAVWLGSGGHAFVCDGYDGNGYFHFNWGWNDKYNGYFLTSFMTPSGAGTGGFIDGYNYTQSVMINLHPDDSRDYALYDYVIGSKFSFSPQDLTCSATLSHGLEGAVEIALSMAQDSDSSNIKVLPLGYTNGGENSWILPSGSLTELDKETIYEVKLLWRANTDTEWRRVAGESTGLAVYNQTPMGGSLLCIDDVWAFNPYVTDLDPVTLEISELRFNDEDYYISGAQNTVSFNVSNLADDYVNSATRCYAVDAAGKQTLFFNFSLPANPSETSSHSYTTKNTLLLPEGEYTIRFINVNTLQEIPCDRTYTLTVYDSASLINHDDGSFKYVVVPGHGASLTATSTGSKLGGDIHIPAEILIDEEPVTVTKVLPTWANIIDKNTATSLIIDYPITEVAGSSFSSITNLTTLSLPESVRRIGKYAGAFNKLMTTLILPSELDFMDEYAFGACYALENIRIPVIEIIPDKCFWGSYAMTDITIPEGVREIGKEAFYTPKALETISLPSTLESLGTYVFGGYVSNSPIREVTCKALTPPEASSNTFINAAYKQATLKVPGGSREQYAAHPVWGKFTNIEEFDLPNGIEELTSPSDAHLASPGTWYTIDGLPIPGTPTAPGIYIRRTYSSAQKVIIPE